MDTTLVAAPGTLNIREVVKFSFYIFRKVFIHAVTILLAIAAVSFAYRFLIGKVDPALLTKHADFTFTPLNIWLLLSYGVLIFTLEASLWQSINATLLNQKNSLFSSFFTVSNYLFNLLGALILLFLLIILMTASYTYLQAMTGKAILSSNISLVCISAGLGFLYYFYFPVIIIENNLNFFRALGRSCRFLYARALETFLLLVALPLLIFIVAILFAYAMINLFFYVDNIQLLFIYSYAAMIPFIYIFYRVLVCVQIYNIKISLGEKPPSAMMDKLFSNSFI